MNNNTESVLKKGWCVFLLALICQVLWGSAIPCIKVAYQLFSVPSGKPMSQILLAGARFTLAGVFTVLIGSISEKRMLIPKRKSFPSIAVLAFFQTIVQYSLLFVGVAHTTSMKSSIIQGSTTFFSIVFAAYLFRQEKITPRKLIGCIIGFAGVVLINFSGDKIDRLSLLGDGLVVIATCSFALSLPLVKKYSEGEDPVLLSGYQFIVGGIVLMLIGYAGGGKLVPTAPKAWLLMAYLGFLSAAAYSLWSLLLKFNPVSRVTIYSCINPICGVVFAALLLDEQNSFTVFQLVLSLALVCAGILIVNLERPREA